MEGHMPKKTKKTVAQPVKLTPAQQAAADKMFADTWAKLDEMDLRMYQLGFVRSGPAHWKTAAMPEPKGAPKNPYPNGRPNSMELHRTPQPLLPAGGAKVGV
jgi:hypothetical protein